MKKVLFVIVLLLVFALLFSACDENKPNTPEIPTAEHTHTLGDWVTDKAATCTENGSKHRECTECGETIATETIPAKGHTFVDGVCIICGERKASEGLAYISYGNGTCYVESIGTCTDTNVVIPSVSPAGDLVVRIGSEAFRGCSAMTSVAIPRTIISIKFSAFSDCTNLTSVYITDLATWCKISFDTNSYSTNPLYYADNLYLNGELITDLVIPEGVTSIKDFAFRGFTGMTSVTIPDSVTSIGDRAFDCCTGLTSITIGKSVSRIGYGTFEDCTSLNAVYITDLANWCNLFFDNNYGSTYGANSNPLYHAKNLYVNGKLVTDLVIPEGVASIGEWTFCYCNMKSVTIPNSVTSIGEDAFRGCTGLTSVTIPDSVTSIGNYAFEGCRSLTSVTIPDSVTSIGSSAFYNCSKLTSITIPDSVTSVGGWAFRECTSLTSVTIPDSVTSIGDSAFRECTSLTSVTIPDSVTSIGGSAFRGCTSLTSVTIPDSVTSIGSSAFSDCPIETATIPASAISSISKGKLKTVVITSGTSIEWSAFSYCTSLTSITVAEGNPVYHSAGNCIIETASKTLIAGCKNSVIPTDGSVTSIGGSAFNNCTSLTSVTIPDSVTSIGERAFFYCTSLTSVTIPDSVTSIGGDAFSYCTSSTSITVAEGNPVYHGAGNCIIETASKTLIAGCKNSVIPTDGSVTSIGSYAFYGCTSLTSVTIPDSVTSIGGSAFNNCSSLTRVTIPDSVTSIGERAFSYCTSLTSIDYQGTKAQWNAISKGSLWNYKTGNYTIHCTDGDIAK